MYNMLITITLLSLIHGFTSNQSAVELFRYCKTYVLRVPRLICGVPALLHMVLVAASCCLALFAGVYVGFAASP